jgi:hypothetical protein
MTAGRLANRRRESPQIGETMRGTRAARRACAAFSIVAVTTLGLVTFAVAPAYAAAPTNDTIQNATQITTVPFTDTVDTTDATTDAVETSLNSNCGAPTVEHGVWYHATATQSGSFTVDSSQSSYGTGIMVVAGPASAPTLLTCGPNSVTGPLTAGQDVFLLVFGDGSTAATSGTMILTVQAAAPPPTVDMTIDSRGSFGRDGSASISGTLTCTGSRVTFAGMLGQVQQRAGRLLISSSFQEQIDPVCDGAPHNWVATAPAGNGLFKGGKATVNIQAEVCNGSGCGSTSASASVKLGGAKH